jgi:hypothetical protein
VLEGAVATLECALHDVADGGDRRILVGRVLAVEHPGLRVDPLLFYRGGFFGLGQPVPEEEEAAVEVALPSGFGDLRLVGVDGGDASVVALVGEPRATTGALVYVHRGCVLGDALGHAGCRRRTALLAALAAMRAEGRGALVYHRDGAEPFGGCCLGTAPPGVAVAPPALRRAVAQLRLRGARLLVDPREPHPLGPASLELDVASTVELRAAA